MAAGGADMSPTQLVPHTRGFWLGGWRLRVKAWRCRRELDEALAAGADPVDSDLLSLRAGQLRAPARRTTFANSLRAAMTLADSDVAYRPLPRALVRYYDVRACRPLLALVADRLESSPEPDVRGLAVVSLLLREGESPLFSDAALESLEARLSYAYNSL
jgi:hypothetical protein